MYIYLWQNVSMHTPNLIKNALEIYFESIPLLQQMSISMVLLKLFEIRSVISKQLKSYE